MYGTVRSLTSPSSDRLPEAMANVGVTITILDGREDISARWRRGQRGRRLQHVPCLFGAAGERVSRAPHLRVAAWQVRFCSFLPTEAGVDLTPDLSFMMKIPTDPPRSVLASRPLGTQVEVYGFPHGKRTIDT
jgi:hypothetical protein